MLSNKVKGLINEVIELYSSSIPTQEVIDIGKESLKEVIELLKSENEEPTLYKVELVHPYTYVDKIMNMNINSINGLIQSTPYTYCVTQYIDISKYEYLTLHKNFSSHRGNFYDENKNFIMGYNQQNYQSGEIMKIPEGAKYFVGCSASNGELPLIYGYTYNKPSPKTFEHESDKEYIVTNVTELKQGDYKTGDTVTTLSYSFNGDLGNGVYDIMTEAEYVHLMKKSAFIPKVATQVDGYGDHILDNGLVARLRIDNDDMRPEQWGAKGDGVTNDCQAFVHMFGKITSGTVTFKEGATYLLGLYGGTIKSPADNPYRAFGCGSLLGGQWFSKPILIGAHNLKLNGNNCLITIPDNCFGGSGMGILNFSGHIENVDLFNFRFDGKGRTLDSNNKNSNHTIFYSSCNAPEDEITLSIHPVGQGEKRSCIENFNIYNNHFFDAGAMHRQAGDWGGDHILIINPTELDGLNIHDNRFEAWGRWVFAIDLGGYGECLKNIKFNHNVCIGANAYEEVNEDGSFKFLIDMEKEEFLKFNPKLNDFGLELSLEQWRWRGLGFIDFEAKKCFDNVELIGNTIIGSGGWAINGASKINKNFIIKDNYWNHVGGGYPYMLECYSGMTENWLIEGNTFPNRCGFKMGYITKDAAFRDNIGLEGIRTFGIVGNIDIQDNVSGGYRSSNSTLWNHGCNVYDDPAFPIEKVKEIGVNVIFKGNDGYLVAKFTDPDDIDKTSFFKYDIELGNSLLNSNIIEFNKQLVIDPSNAPQNIQYTSFKGVKISNPVENGDLLIKSIFYVEKGQLLATNCQKWGGVRGDLFMNKLIENFKQYNWNWSTYAQRNNINKISIICTEGGYHAGGCEYGFRDQCTHISYILNNNLNCPDGAYINTDDDIYYTKLGGKLTQIPTHKEGMVVYTDENGNSIDLYYIGKVGKFELVIE